VKAFRDAGVVVALVIVIAGSVLVGAARPAQVLVSAYSDQDYALDALALEYLGDYVKDPLLRRYIAQAYWCGTPVVEELEQGRKEDRTEEALRARAQALAQRHAGMRCRVVNSSGRTLSAQELANVPNPSAYLIVNRRIECEHEASAGGGWRNE
jgi:hypothetical protein